MKTCLASQEISLVRTIIIAFSLFFLCLTALFFYRLFGHPQAFQGTGSRSLTFEIEQLAADTRTAAAALRYLLEPKPPQSACNNALAGLRVSECSSRREEAPSNATPLPQTDIEPPHVGCYVADEILRLNALPSALH